MHIKEEDRALIATALRIAAEKYLADEKECASTLRIADQFRRQRERSLVLAGEIEDGE